MRELPKLLFIFRRLCSKTAGRSLHSQSDSQLKTNSKTFKIDFCLEIVKCKNKHTGMFVVDLWGLLLFGAFDLRRISRVLKSWVYFPVDSITWNYAKLHVNLNGNETFQLSTMPVILDSVTGELQRQAAGLLTPRDFYLVAFTARPLQCCDSNLFDLFTESIRADSFWSNRKFDSICAHEQAWF